MHLIIGGRYMGKKKYAEKIYGSFKPQEIFNFEIFNLNNLYNLNNKDYKLIINLHLGIKNLLLLNKNPEEFFSLNLEFFLRAQVVIIEEISSGIIPVNKLERQWRDETGLIYQKLAEKAEIVDRVWAGLPLRLKG